MKIIINISTLILIIICSNCGNPSSSEKNDRFAIYLLKNDALTTKDVEEVKLLKLILNDAPVISFNDLVGYQIKNHKVYLNEKLANYFNSDSLKIFAQYFGIPFVLIADGERIYLGSFHSGLSSWGSNTPKILDYSVNNIEKSFIISGAPIYDESTYIDERNDNRIFKALGDKIIQ